MAMCCALWCTVYCLMYIKINKNNDRKTYLFFSKKTSHVHSDYHRKILDFLMTECEKGDVR